MVLSRNGPTNRPYALSFCWKNVVVACGSARTEPDHWAKQGHDRKIQYWSFWKQYHKFAKKIASERMFLVMFFSPKLFRVYLTVLAGYVLSVTKAWLFQSLSDCCNFIDIILYIMEGEKSIGKKMRFLSIFTFFMRCHFSRHGVISSVRHKKFLFLQVYYTELSLYFL